MELPEWINREAWDGFVEMRKTAKKPMTARAQVLLIHKLGEFQKKGHDVNACLDQSTLRNWQTVYPLKDEAIPDMNPQTYEPEKLSTEEWERGKAARERIASMVGSVIRRVA